MDNKKKGPGRPRKSSGKRKSEAILVRVEPTEKRGFAEAASLAGIDLSVWVRERLRWAATKELQAGGRGVPFLDPVQE